MKNRIVAMVAVLLIAGGYAGWRAVKAWETEVLDSKSVRSGRGIVERKERILVDETNARYVNDFGSTIERPLGSVEYRVYYRVLDFGPYSKSKSDVLWTAENRRRVAETARSEIVYEEQYNQMRIGDTVEFNNQYVGGNDAMTWGLHSVGGNDPTPLAPRPN